MRTQRIILLLALSIYYSTNLTTSFKCLCNVCGIYQDYCEPSSSSESQCFKSVEKVLSNETYIIDTIYGCLSGGEGLLAPLQCHTNNIGRDNPRHMACCKGVDYCNEDLPDPDLENDPRWRIEKPKPKPDDAEPFSLDTKVIAFVIILALCSAFATLIVSLVFCCTMKKLKRSSKESRGSTCSLKTDLDNKFHVQSHTTGSSSASTHSYSLSLDLNQKTATHDTSHEDSYMTQDLTSGIGERLLCQRTMARAVGFGPTDHVGNGRFGRVFRGKYHGEDVAVKAFRTIDSESWSREDSILRGLNHENIVRFLASETTSVDNNSSEIWMFLEFCNYGSLCDFLDTNEILGQQQAVKILYSIINGLNYLHEDYSQASKLYKSSIAHRDIKSKNILMRTPYSCCIADFGHALIKIDEERLDYGKYQYLQVGTIRYMAPEILRPSPALNYRHFLTFAQADLYQFGLILWEVCHRTRLDISRPTGHHKLPYEGVVLQNPDIQDMIKIVCDDQCRPPRYEIWESYEYMKELSNLMVECWRPNPRARMETLGIKLQLKKLHDKVAPQQSQGYITLPDK